MGFCLLCLNPSKTNATNINESVKDAQDLLIGDLIRIYLTFGEVRVEKLNFKFF